MKTINKVTLVTLFCFFVEGSYAQITSLIKGTVIDNNSEYLLITPITEDFNNIMILSKGTVVPIKDSKFEFELNTPHLEEFYVILQTELEEQFIKGYQSFFPDSSVIEITIFPDKIEVNGGELNRIKRQHFEMMFSKYEPYLKIEDSLMRNESFYSDYYQDLRNKISDAKNNEERNNLIKEIRLLIESNEAYTSEALMLINRFDSLESEFRKWENNYIENNLNEYSYALLYKFSEDRTNTDFVNTVFPLYSEKFPEHPYTKLIEEMNRIHVGGYYIDFNAPTYDGEMITISDSITGKIALIDLWATWCGSCIAKSRTMVPIFEKYKEKGFTIIGVVGVYKNMNDYKIATERENFPWLNLVEFNNQNGIWAKYGISGSGGSSFLVNTKGQILAINPSAEEVDGILQRLLK